MTTIEVLADGSANVSVVETAAVEIEVVETPAIEVEVLQGGFVQQIIGIDPEYTIAVGVIENDPTVYKEFSYTSGDLTQISTWGTSAKNTLLIQKTLTYSNGDLASVTTTYSGVSLRTDYTFTNGDLVATDTMSI